MAQETGIHRQRILPALTDVGDSFQKDIPDIFSGTGEVDETYIGHNGTTKDTTPKPVVGNVEEGVPKLLFLAS